MDEHRMHMPHHVEPETVSIKKDTLWKGATFVFAILFIVSLFTGGFGIGDGVGTGQVIDNPTPSQPTPSPSVPAPAPAAVKVEIAGNAILGDEDAPVTIIEFSDYECPFCGRHYSQTSAQIIKEYVDTGKVKLVFRDFPLGFHANAQKAGEAAECAGEQGKYWEMHDKLFENQQSIGIENLKAYAKDIGLNTEEFNTCLDTGAMADEIAKDMADGQAAGVRGTPAFFINGKLLSGAQPFEAFKAAIDAELA